MSADRLETIVQSGRLRVGTSMDTPGFSMRRADGGLEGFDIDALETLSKATGIAIDFVRMDFPTMLEELAADKFDIAMSGMGRTVQRATVATFSRPYLRNGRSLITRSVDRDRFQSLADADRAGVRIGHRTGAVNAEFAQRAFKNASLFSFATNEAITAKLLAGEVDVQVADATVATYMARTNSDLVVVDPSTIHEPVYVAILLNRHDHTLLNFINIWLDHIDQNGTLAQLTAKWLGAGYK